MLDTRDEEVNVLAEELARRRAKRDELRRRVRHGRGPGRAGLWVGRAGDLEQNSRYGRY